MTYQYQSLHVVNKVDCTYLMHAATGSRQPTDPCIVAAVKRAADLNLIEIYLLMVPRDDKFNVLKSFVNTSGCFVVSVDGIILTSLSNKSSIAVFIWF